MLSQRRFCASHLTVSGNFCIHVYRAECPHHLPHFHTYYGEYSATFTLMPPETLEGALPRTQLRLVLAWAELYRIDPIARTLSWPNGADFDAETLRNWPDYKDELASRAQSWERVLA